MDTSRPENSTTVRSSQAVLAAAVSALAKVAPGLAESLVARLFTVTVPGSRRVPLVPNLKPSVLALRGAKHALRAYAYGNGVETVLLVHGWNGHAGQMTRFVRPLVANGFRAVLLDLPAHGASGGRTATLIDLADAIDVAARALGPIAGTIAHSLGATATTLAVSNGSPLGRIVLLAPPAEMPFFARAFASVVGLPDAQQDGMIARIERRVGVRAEDLDLRRVARTLTAPALVFHAPDDSEVPFSHGRDVARAWPGAELVPVPGLGHRRLLREPRVVQRAVDHVLGPEDTETLAAREVAS